MATSKPDDIIVNIYWGGRLVHNQRLDLSSQLNAMTIDDRPVNAVLQSIDLPCFGPVCFDLHLRRKSSFPVSVAAYGAVGQLISRRTEIPAASDSDDNSPPWPDEPLISE